MPDIRRSHILEELNRHKSSVVHALARLNGLPSDDLARAEQATFERIAFLVSFILENQQLRDVYLSMLDLPMTWAEHPKMRKALSETRKLMRKSADAIEHAGLHKKRAYSMEKRRFDKWLVWSGSFSDLVAKVRQHLKDDVRESLPGKVVSDHEMIAHELARAERVLLGTGSTLVTDTISRFKLDALADLAGFGMRYAGCDAAQLLASVFLKCCPSGISELTLSRLSQLLVDPRLAGRRWSNASHIDAHEMELAVDDVCARLEAATTSRAQRLYFTSRLTTYFTMYGKERVRERLEALARQSCTRYEERIFRPLVEELAFNHGLFAMPEVQLAGDRPDIVMQEMDAWYVYELKQLGFGSGPKTEKKALSLLTEGMSKSHSYREKLSPMQGIQNDVYILLFVNGQASFVDDGTLSARHVIERDGISYQLQLVNVPLKTPTHRIRIPVSELCTRTRWGKSVQSPI